MCDNPAASNEFVWHLHRATLKGLVSSKALAAGSSLEL
jgi:hypothetical protein